MVFSSITFLAYFLPALLVLYFLIRPEPLRNVVLLVFSLIFYGWSGERYLILLLISVLVNYVCGLGAGFLQRPAQRKLSVALACVVGLGLLGYFKYAGFAVRQLNLLGLGLTVPNIVLPIGISFYTFQGLSYVIDVYRDRTLVQKNPLNVALYVALFPQLVAGPIVRYTTVARDIRERKESIEKFASGVIRFCFGMGKKMLIANAMGEVADAAFNHTTGPGALQAWLGILAYTLQIYFDFSAYSDMAIGLGRIFGFSFLENFNYPYISKSVTEFWRRWHMSLGTWFRDYVYIPLGGSRKGLPRQIVNLLIVWALTGLWHGASWTFLFWGLYYAFFLILEKLFLLRWLERHHTVGHVYTLLVAVSGWVIFQQTSVSQTLVFFQAMCGLGPAGFCAGQDLYYLAGFGPVLLAACFASLPAGKALFAKLPEKAQSVAVPVLILAVLTVSTAYLVDSTYNPFLYFKF